jgi:hypothetical protein
VKSILILLAALALGGCRTDGEKPMDFTVTTVTEDKYAPAECFETGAGWQPLPDKDVHQAEAVANQKVNKRRLRAIQSDQRVCRVGLKTAGFKPS